MTQETQLVNVVGRIRNEFNSVRSEIDAVVAAAYDDADADARVLAVTGDKSTLTTTIKTTLVAAINELDADIAALEAGAAGIDDGVTATTSTWSSDKINTEITDSAAATKAEILGGADAAWDTLQEIKAIIDASDAADDDALAALTTAVGNRVRFDAAQSLTGTQQTQARDNIGAISAAAIGDPEHNYVTDFENGLL
jgi:hypothetical protein